MTQDEIRKLLGGYATNELSAEERRVLFEAALEDQALFNALENEDALRELLEDPLSREQLREALGSPIARRRRTNFWSRRWLIGVAIPAMVAVIVILIMNRANAPRLIAPPVQTASDGADQIAAGPQSAPPEIPPAPPEVKREAKESVGAKASRLELAAPAPAAAPIPSTRTAMASLRVGALRQMSEAVRQQFASGFAGNAPLYQGPLVKYSLVRSGPTGNQISVEVTPQIGGYLALYRVDAAGNSQRVYPVRDVAERVFPGVTVRIPSVPIKIADAGERLRLVVVPQSVVVGTVGGFVNGVADQAAPLATAPTPLVVDIPLAPN